LQFIALVLIDTELSVLNGGESSKLRGRINQGANKPGGKRAGCERARERIVLGEPGWISQRAKKPECEKAKRQTSQEANQAEGERAKERKNQGTKWQRGERHCI